ncbi:MAG TPA: agmatine deiminase family protein [Candidatus Thermoplasmatota archaeon]|nr:agmatine deiminase family protein [Candidatus Thermoplasmatota archaeon]
MQNADLVALRGPVPTPRQMGYRMPAEWERQESVWLVWPRDPLTWPGRVEAARGTFLAAMRAVTPHQRVDLVVHPDLLEAAQAAVAGAGIKNVAFHAVDHQDSWIRDYGPIYLTKGPPERRERMAVRFGFNAWGNKYESLLRDRTVVAQLGERVGAPLQSVEMVLEGGSIDVDGQGTLITTTQCLLNENRNPDMGEADIEAHLREYLGVEKVLWLGDGIAGDDTDGHVDDVARFVAPTLVVTAVEEDRTHPNHAPLDENLHLLQTGTDAHRRPLRVVELPMPRDQLGDGGQALPASHANFLITNGAVLMPTFGGPSDEVARRRLQQCFKDRPVVPLDCRDLVWGMGAIHCLSQQVPATSHRVQRSAVDEVLGKLRPEGVRSDRLARD